MQMALEPDSNLYPNNLSVIIEEWSGSFLRRTLMLDTITIPNKEPGIFFSPNQPVYFTSSVLDPAYKYKLRITNLSTGKIITSETNLVGDFGIIRPAALTSINFDVPTQPTRVFSWHSASNAGRYQLIVRFNYLEVNIDTHDTIARQLDWKSPLIKAGNGEMELKFQNEAFFSMVATQVPKIPNIIRFPVNIELIFYVAATDLSTYIEVNEPSASLVQVKPEFTNIENGLGVFSARYSKVSPHPIHFQTIDRLASMEGYNFQDFF